jgi:hypothetical protein
MDSVAIESARVAETYDVFAFCPESPFFIPKPRTRSLCTGKRRRIGLGDSGTVATQFWQ